MTHWSQKAQTKSYYACSMFPSDAWRSEIMNKACHVALLQLVSCSKIVMELAIKGNRNPLRDRPMRKLNDKGQLLWALKLKSDCLEDRQKFNERKNFFVGHVLLVMKGGLLLCLKIC